jgi:DNA-binding MarR family transcriptional regulator
LQRLLSSRRVADRMVEAAGIKLSQQSAAVLRAVALDGASPSVAEVAKAAQMDTGAVSRQLNVLEEQRLVTRRPSPHHGSVVLVSPTARGRELAARDDYVRKQHLRNVLAAWTPQEREQFGQLFRRFVDDLQHTPLPHADGDGR